MRGDWRRTLLACLLEARASGREGVDRDELLDVLYPGAAARAAHTALKQLVYQLRRSLGAKVILLAGDAYALGPVDTDAELFLTNGDTSLWRGPAFEGVTAGTRADRTRDLLHRHLAATLRAHLDSDTHEAARLGRILVEAEPYDADVLTLALESFRAEGDLRALASYYREGRARLAEVGEDLPEAWTDFLGVARSITRVSPGTEQCCADGRGWRGATRRRRVREEQRVKRTTSKWACHAFAVLIAMVTLVIGASACGRDTQPQSETIWDSVHWDEATWQ